MNLAERVKELRKEVGLSQTDLGKMVGVPYQSIQNIELGRVKNPRYMPQLAEALKTSIDYLVNGTTEGDPKPVVHEIAHIVAVDKDIEPRLERDFYVVSIERGKKLFLTDGATEEAKITQTYKSHKA